MFDVGEINVFNSSVTGNSTSFQIQHWIKQVCTQHFKKKELKYNFLVLT